MKRIVLGFILAVIVLYSYNYFKDKNETKSLIIEQSHLIEQQIKNVNKLVVTEGNFSEVFTYKDSKELLGDYFSAEKKALVVVNAKVNVAFDLNKISFELDEENKILTIKNIPKEELSINPDIEYYDIQADYLNPFEASDYNKIKKEVNQSLMKKINNSNLKTNAKDRLLNELAKFYILTNSLGWTLQYNETSIDNASTFNQFEFLN